MDIKPTTPADELPCTCTSMDQYVDGLCPGCIEAADRDADLKEHVDAQVRLLCAHAFPKKMIEDAFEGDDESAVREGDDDRFYSGSGESIGDSPYDDSYTQYLNRG
jgi:hypothetical protein